MKYLPFEIINKFKLRLTDRTLNNSYDLGCMFYQTIDKTTYLTSYDVNANVKMPEDLWLLCGKTRHMTVSFFAMQEGSRHWFNELINYVNS